jgi:hypothetical protein
MQISPPSSKKRMPAKAGIFVSGPKKPGENAGVIRNTASVSLLPQRSSSLPKA